MNKKGTELSMNLIIIAAIGLLVLVILAVLIIGSGNRVVTGMKTCNALGGTCENSCVTSSGTREQLNGDCSNSVGKQCCKVFSISTG